MWEAGSRKIGDGSRNLGEVGLMMEQMSFKFEKIIVWQKAMDFGEDIHRLAKKLPDEEKFNLSSQIRRAADSIALNIAEGSIAQSNPEFKKFLGYSIRSLAEVVTCLQKIHRREYILNEEFTQLYDFAFNLMNMLVAFRNNIK